MGLTRHGVRFLLHCRSTGVDYADFAMIGRQTLHLNVAELRAAGGKGGLQLSRTEAEHLFTDDSEYAEPFFRCLGATSISSFDASPYERATHVADFNSPLPDTFLNRYSAVLDGGSLEHVFNYPQGLKNAMQMVRPGGHLLLITPTHSLSGHGFYQLSPELFFRAFSAENGYGAPQVLVCSTKRDTWYSVADPSVVRGRVLLDGKSLTDHLFIVSKRLSNAPIFARWPLQSDYSSMWGRAEERVAAPMFSGIKDRLRANRHRIPAPLLRAYRRWTARDPQGLTRIRL